MSCTCTCSKCGLHKYTCTYITIIVYANKLTLYEYILLCLLYYCYHSHGEDAEVEQKKQIKPHIPPAKAEGNLLTQLLDPPMVLMIQTELCEKKTLKSWLSDHINDRKRRTVVNFFEQVHLLITCTYERVP